MFNGIDISDYNTVDSFHEVASDGISFIYCKATEGLYNTQDSFAQNRSRIASVGIAFGAYHYMDWAADPVGQAHHFLSVYRPSSGDLPPMLDIEAIDIPQDAATTKVSQFLATCEPYLNHTKMLLYMNWDTINSQKINTSYFEGHPLWLAQYGSSYNVPQTWTAPTIWQYTDSKAVTGIEGNVDGDVCYVSLDSIRLKL